MRHYQGQEGGDQRDVSICAYGGGGGAGGPTYANKVSPAPDLSVEAAYRRAEEMCDLGRTTLSVLTKEMDRLLGAAAPTDAIMRGEAQPPSGASAQTPPMLWMLHDQLSTLNSLMHRISTQLERLGRI